MKKVLKKIITVYLASSFMMLSVFAQGFDYSNYDFSDEAQTQFDNQQLYNANPVKTYDKTGANKGQNVSTQVEEEQRNVIQPQFEPVVLPRVDEYTNYNRDDLQEASEVNNPYLTEKTLSGGVVFVPTGTILEIEFESGISSGSLDRNDRLMAVLPSDFVYKGKVIAPRGSFVYGTVTSAKSAGYAYGTGDMELNFTQILPPEGNPINISTETIVVKAKSSRGKNMSRDVLVGAGIGLVGGLLTYLLTGSQSSESFVRAVAVGGGIGAVSGGLRGSMTRGEDVKIPEGTRIKLKLTNPINVNPYYQGIENFTY